MLQCSFSFVAAQLLVKTTSSLQKSEGCSAVYGAQLSENCSATSVFDCGMLQGWGLEGWFFFEGLAERVQKECAQMTVGFLYGAGAETLIFVTGPSGK